MKKYLTVFLVLGISLCSVDMPGLGGPESFCPPAFSPQDEEALETLIGNIQGKQHEHFPNQTPVKEKRITSPFGWRKDPFTFRMRFHQGIDFSGKHGTEVYAAAKGRVVYAGWHVDYGRVVDIDHGEDLMTRYAHNSVLKVVVGQMIEKGEHIAHMGSTGRATGTHLHFEVRFRGVEQNPAWYLHA
jgi:murein DD-endopeptidase MepM/ murein hydrolase activator NlpD